MVRNKRVLGVFSQIANYLLMSMTEIVSLITVKQFLKEFQICQDQKTIYLSANLADHLEKFQKLYKKKCRSKDYYIICK